MEQEKRLGIVGIFLENLERAETVNEVLHAYSDIIVARMGIPYRERGLSVISLIVDGPGDEINAMTGKLGRIADVSVQAMLQKA